MPTTEAMNADGASDATRRSPNPPDLTGKLACSHWLSESDTLQILHNATRSRLSN